MDVPAGPTTGTGLFFPSLFTPSTSTHTKTVENEEFITVITVITAYAYMKRLKLLYRGRETCFI
jgi:hypothetical protein